MTTNNKVQEKEETLKEYKRKIEQAHNCRLVELPCFIGDTIYIPRISEIRKGKEKYAIDTYEVLDITIYTKEIILFRVKPTGGKNYSGNVHINENGEKWFTSKNQAEKKIKNLEKENKV